MKVVCSQSELNSALQLVSRAVATRPTHPVLANVLLTADAGSNRLSLTGFDLSLGIQTSQLKTLPNNFYLIMAFAAFRKSRMASMALTVINDRNFGTFKCGLQRQINSAHFIHFQ